MADIRRQNRRIFLTFGCFLRKNNQTTRLRDADSEIRNIKPTLTHHLSDRTSRFHHWWLSKGGDIIFQVGNITIEFRNTLRFRSDADRQYIRSAEPLPLGTFWGVWYLWHLRWIEWYVIWCSGFHLILHFSQPRSELFYKLGYLFIIFDTIQQGFLVGSYCLINVSLRWRAF